MVRVALAFAYDGTRFDSYARQPGRRTVESELLAALRAARVVRDARSARFASGSRTDRGASAAFNVCAFDTAAASAQAVGRPRPPEGLWLLSARRVDDAFDPRRAVGRAYRYFLPREPGLDLAAARRAFAAFEGTHDFSAFARHEEGRDPRRSVDRARVTARGGLVAFSVSGQSFLWQQVRRMVWAARQVGIGRWAVGDVRSGLADPRGALAVGAVPAEGLLLESVRYPFRFPRPWRVSLQEAGRRAALAEVRRGLAVNLLNGARRARR